MCTGWAAREWWAVRPSDGNLKTRTLGLVSSIAAGLAIALPQRKVIAIDGDGAFLMNLCGLPTIALQSPGNLIHLLVDNEVYEASGGTATASRMADAVALGPGRGLQARFMGQEPGRISFAAFDQAWQRNELTLIAVKVEPGQPKDLPPLKLDEIENKYRFMRYLEATEKRADFESGLRLYDLTFTAPRLIKTRPNRSSRSASSLEGLALYRGRSLRPTGAPLIRVSPLGFLPRALPVLARQFGDNIRRAKFDWAAESLTNSIGPETAGSSLRCGG